jgi:hypothetical protein
MKKLKVHPVAELFPMMSEEELDDLAADIKANGLRQPIVVDQDGVLIDGRNRLEACKRAGVEPEETVLDGQDPVAFILSSNIYRRNLNKGQAAMVIAKACPLSGQGVRQLGALGQVSKTRIAQANVVLEFAPDLVDAVMARSLSLNDAYQTALDRKAAANTTEKQLEKLQAEAPDLFDLVSEERLKLAEAIATLRNRKDEEKKHRQLTSRLFSEAILLFNPQANTPAELAEHLFAAIDPELVTIELSPEVLKRSLEVLKIIVSKWNKQYGKAD